jgi:hypothetical protein
MKQLLLVLILPTVLAAQGKPIAANVQIHRDFDREIFTSTLELLETDGVGSSFFFTDFDYDSAGQVGSYFELTRNFHLFRLGAAWANMSAQFNDGVLSSDASEGKGIPRTVLVGAAVADILWGGAYLEFQALARQEFSADLGWQLTAVWDWPVPHTPLEFLGYLDWNSNYSGSQHLPSVQTEPQIQIRVSRLAVGSEIEISRNFTGAYTRKGGFNYRQWYVHPTVYLRAYF